MLEVLTNPNRFFEAKAKGEREEKGEGEGEGEGARDGAGGGEASLKIPALIVLTSGLVSGISAFLIANMIEALGVVSPFGGVGAFVVSVVVYSLVFWVVFAALFFGVSCVFKGEGKFKRTLEFVGYGYIPTIIGGLISAALVYNSVSTAQIEALAPLMTMMRLSSAVGLLFMLWSANIWVFGLKHARNLSTKNAVLTVAIPVAAYVLYTVWQLLRLGVV